MIRRVAAIAWAFCLLSGSTMLIRAEQPNASEDKFLGRWDVTVHAANGTNYPSWFEIQREGDKLTGRFVGRVGSQRPLTKVEISGGQLNIALPSQYERQIITLGFTGKFVGNKLMGDTTDEEQKPAKWTATRAPLLMNKKAPVWGKPVTLFNGRDLTGWQLRDPKSAKAWKVEDGVLVNEPGSTDIVSTAKFKDFKLHIEFKMVEGSNSGVYTRGRYEVQIQDDFGKDPDSRRMGGVYGFIAPTKNAAKRAGEWQTYDITLIGRRITVVLNGETVIENAEIPGITGGALDSDEGAAGAIMMQGDHGKIYYRNIVITPAR